MRAMVYRPLLGLILMVTIVTIVPALAAKPRIAVLEFSNVHRAPALANPQAAKALTRAFVHFLAGTQRFEIVSNPALESKLSREAVQSDPEVAEAAAKTLALDYLVTGLLEGDIATTEASASFIQMSSANSGAVVADVRAAGITVPAVGYLGFTLARRAAAAFPLQGVVLQPLSRTEFIVNLGREDGLKAGTGIEVRTVANECRNAAGEIIYRDLKLVGRATVTGVDAKSAKCEGPPADIPIVAGMPVCAAAPAESQEQGRARLTVAIEKPVIDNRGGGDANPEFLSELLTGAMAGASDDITVLERSQLAAIRDEIALCQSPEFDWEQTVKAGKRLGATTLVIPAVSRRGNEYRLSARIDDVATSRILETASLAGTDLYALATPLAQEIIKALRPLVPEDLGEGLPRAKLSCDLAEGIIPTMQYRALPRLDLGLVQWTLENTSAEPCLVRITTNVPGYTAASYTEEIALNARQRLNSLGHTPPLDPAKVGALADDSTPAQIKCVMELVQNGQGRKMLEQSYGVRLLRPGLWSTAFPSQNSAIPTVALMIQDSELLVKLRGEAARIAKMNRLVGYQTEAPAAGAAALTSDDKRELVRDQVEAIYKAVASRGVKYVEQSTINLEDSGIQRLLTPDQVLSGGGANCLDSTVLFASLLYPVVRPIMIITDDHAFVGWHTWNSPDAPYEVLETTRVGVADFDQAVAEARKQAEEAGVLDLLAGKDGALVFGSNGQITYPRKAGPQGTIPGLLGLLDVRCARAYFQSSAGPSAIPPQ
ncbi:MAG: hypothetical protein ACYC63_02010 [Armatimonadota bacterium]